MQRCVFSVLDEDTEVSKLDLDTKVLLVRDEILLSRLWDIFTYTYRFNSENSSFRSTLLQQVCKERGWREFRESFFGPSDLLSTRGAQGWNLWWKPTTINCVRTMHLKSWQITNHIPNATLFSRKDVLARYLRRMKSTYNSVFDFSPLSYILPAEYTRLVAEHTRRIGQIQYGFPEDSSCLSVGPYTYLRKGKKAPIWISKPVAKSQGRGITVFDHAAFFSYNQPCVVQEYIYRPFLINQYKWDLRLYVCVTCTNPLTIYAYREGITRFATKKYDINNLPNTFAHLTNTSINKHSSTYKTNKDTVGFGCKWTLKKLRRYLESRKVDDYFLWQRIWSILVLIIVGDGNNISRLDCKANSFEFLGFDILVDEQLKPHLLEVNINPALSSDLLTGVDEEVKKPMLHEMFDLLGLPDGRQFKPTKSEPYLLATSQRVHRLTDEDLLGGIYSACKDGESLKTVNLKSMKSYSTTTTRNSKEKSKVHSPFQGEEDQSSKASEENAFKNYMALLPKIHGLQEAVLAEDHSAKREIQRTIEQFRGDPGASNSESIARSWKSKLFKITDQNSTSQRDAGLQWSFMTEQCPLLINVDPAVKINTDDDYPLPEESLGPQKYISTPSSFSYRSYSEMPICDKNNNNVTKKYLSNSIESLSNNSNSSECDSSKPGQNCKLSSEESNKPSTPQAPPHSTPILLPILKGPKDKVSFPRNGPGLNLLPRNWSKNAPTVCGDWVRIFPFDQKTQKLSKFEGPQDVRCCISRITDHLKLTKDLTRCNSTDLREDDLDAKLRTMGNMNTEIWHP